MFFSLEDLKILEIGCAEGGFIAACIEKNISVEGLELESSRVEIAKKIKRNINIQLGDKTDEVIFEKFKNDRFMIIANASNVDKVLNFLNDNNKDFNVNINYLNDNFSLIALQGPRSRNLLKNISDKKIDLDFYSLKNTKILNKNFILSRTGYTGELGFEIIGRHNDIIDLWKYFISKNVKPCGLAVRDI